MNLVALLIAPIAIAPIFVGARTAIVAVAVVALAVAVIFSKRGGIVTEEEIEAETPAAEKELEALES